MFFSPSTGGFYDEAIHGARTLEIPDAAWTPPLINVTLQPNEQYFNGTETITNPGPDALVLTNVPDWTVPRPLVDTPNPDCKVPADAVQITRADYLALLQAQEDGQEIVAGPDGRPVARDRLPETFEAAKSRALALLRAERAPVMSVLDGLQSSAASKSLAALLLGDSVAATSHNALATTIEGLKQGLKDATTEIPFDSCATFEEMRQAGKAYYAGLVAGAPVEIVNAFRQVA